MLPELFYKLSNPSVTFYDLLPGGPFKPIIIMTLGETLIWETGGTTAVDGVFKLITSTLLFYRTHLRFLTKIFIFLMPKEPLCFHGICLIIRCIQHISHNTLQGEVIEEKLHLTT